MKTHVETIERPSRISFPCYKTAQIQLMAAGSHGEIEIREIRLFCLEEHQRARIVFPRLWNLVWIFELDF